MFQLYRAKKQKTQFASRMLATQCTPVWKISSLLSSMTVPVSTKAQHQSARLQPTYDLRPDPTLNLGYGIS